MPSSHEVAQTVAPEREPLAGLARLRMCGRLFAEMFAIALFVLGGGFAILATAEDRFSRKLKWTREGELMDMLPIFQMVPGIIAGHTAVCLGRRLAGAWGAAAALCGTVLPSVLVFTAVSVFYDRIPVDHPLLVAAFRGLRAAMTAILAVMMVRSGRKTLKGVFAWCIFGIALVLLTGFRLPPGYVILTAMVVGIGYVRADTLRRARVSRAPSSKTFNSFWAIPLVFLVYGLIAFGGGYVLVPVYIRDFVGETARYLQLAPDEFANVMALTQMTPGPIGVNCATYFGFRMGGFAGAFVATLSLVLPGSLILYAALGSLDRFRSSTVVRGIFAGVRPVTIALLVGATLAFAGMSVVSHGADGGSVDGLGCVLVVLATLAFGLRKLGAVATILASAALAVALACARTYVIQYLL